MSRYYRRHLPHGSPNDTAVFVTFNLKGSLPQEALDRIERIRKDFDSRIVADTNLAQLEMARQIFRISEEFLDAARTGPMYLQNSQAAETVAQNLLGGAQTFYELFAFVVMTNHVHLLIKPKVELERITGGIKKNTARKINALLQRVGESFWQDESFDHRPRDRESLIKILNYIENNPVKAGLCKRPEEWRWSSARMRSNWPMGEVYKPTA